MKKIIKLLATLTLMFSCFYLAFSLFLDHLLISDVLTNIIESTAVTEALVDSCKEAFQTFQLDENQTREVVSSFQQDATIQHLISESMATAINDAMLDENTYDDTLLKEALQNKKEDIYELIQPNVSKDLFSIFYDQAINQIDLKDGYQQAVSKIQDKVNHNKKLKYVKKVYELKNKPNTIISILLMILSTAYLLFISYRNKRITKCLSLTYLLSGIMTFFIAFAIALSLTTVVSSWNIQLPSIKYMYLCGSGYFFGGIVLLIINAFFKRTNA